MNINRFVLWIYFLALAFVYFGTMDRIALTDPDEVFYSLTAQEMIDHGEYVTPLIFGQPQFEKPPLFYWLLISSFQLFGLSPFAARLIPALFGYLGVVMTFWFCCRAFNNRVAFLSALMLGTSALYLAMSKAVLTDIVLCVLMMAGFYAFYLWYLEKKQVFLYALALAAALAVLTKGPIAIIILGITCAAFLCLKKEWARLRAFLFHPWTVVFLLLALPWYVRMITLHGRAFFDEFIIHDNWHRILRAEHEGFDTWHFYPMIVATGLFPWMFYFLLAGSRFKEWITQCWFFVIWVVVTLLIFQCAHSKLASYILPAFPALIIMLSVLLDSLLNDLRRSTLLSVLYAVSGLIILILARVLIKLVPEFTWPYALIAINVLGFSFLLGAYFLWQGKWMRALGIKAAGLITAIVLTGIYVPTYIDRAVADQFLKEIVQKENYQGETILCSKIFARGVYFYTGNPVKVIDQNPQPFWSPHPIETIAGDYGLIRYWNNKDRVLFVIKEDHLFDLERAAEGKREQRIIARYGFKCVVMSEKISE